MEIIMWQIIYGFFILQFASVYRESAGCTVAFDLLKVFKCLHILRGNLEIHFRVGLHVLRIAGLGQRPP